MGCVVLGLLFLLGGYVLFTAALKVMLPYIIGAILLGVVYQAILAYDRSQRR